MEQTRPHEALGVYGRYETLFRIAAGGMAEVYVARARGDAGFQKLVALKRMLPHLTHDRRFVTMFMDEARLAAHISSPHVVSTLDLDRADDGSLYLVMELVVGTTLSTLLRNAARTHRPIPIEAAVELIAQAAQGLHDAHEARTPCGSPLRIVHRDVSPQNILVGADGRVRITDFGVARAKLRCTKSSTGELKGKFGYVSPEHTSRDLDRRSDVFSLGVVAWETLTTRRLFHADNAFAAMERVMRMPIPAVDAVNPEVPAGLASVVATALARDRGARFPTAGHFARALRQAARDTVGVAEPIGIAELVATHGGECLERIQRGLRDSGRSLLLGSRDATTPDQRSGEEDEDEADTTVERGDGHDDAAVPSVASPVSAVTATAARTRRSTLTHAASAVMAVLGLAAGATFGLLVASAGPHAPRFAVNEPRPGIARASAVATVPPAVVELARAPQVPSEAEPEVPEDPWPPRTTRRRRTEAPRHPRRAGARTTRSTVESGFLAVQTLPWTRVFVDGHDTGLDTPVLRLALPAGRRVIGLRTNGGVTHTVRITVEAGRTHRIVREL